MMQHMVSADCRIVLEFGHQLADFQYDAGANTWLSAAAVGEPRGRPEAAPAPAARGGTPGT
jgi:hypothetical protein